MPLSAVIILTIDRPAHLPRDTGQAVHGWFFKKVLPQLDPALAAEHDQTEGLGRPFTLSSLIGGEDSPEDPTSQCLQPGRSYWLRLTALDEAHARALARLGELAGQMVEILNARLKLAQIALSLTEHPWARSISYEALWQHWQKHIKRTELDRPIRLEFRSPTLFHHDDADQLPFPIPTLIFESLARRWNRYAPQPVAPIDHLERLIEVLRYEIRCKSIDLGFKRPWSAFTGWCEFGFTPEARSKFRLLRDLNMLADFAFYAGIGYKTAMGLGQVERVFDAELTEP